jgi:hypothetical protein
VSTPDPNADLSGYVFPVDMPQGVVDGTVIGSASWISAYVELETEHGRTVRVAAQGASEEGANPVTELQKMYAAARVNGKRGHHGALRAIARQTGIDEATVDRCLKRARRTDVLESKRAKKGAKSEAVQA